MIPSTQLLPLISVSVTETPTAICTVVILHTLSVDESLVAKRQHKVGAHARLVSQVHDARSLALDVRRVVLTHRRHRWSVSDGISNVPEGHLATLPTP